MAGQLRDGRIEWMGAVANRLPMMIVGRHHRRPRRGHRQAGEIGVTAATQMVEGLVGEEQLAAAGVAVMELGGYIMEQLERAAADPQDDLLGDLARACASGVIDQIRRHCP